MKKTTWRQVSERYYIEPVTLSSEERVTERRVINRGNPREVEKREFDETFRLWINNKAPTTIPVTISEMQFDIGGQLDRVHLGQVNPAYVGEPPLAALTAAIKDDHRVVYIGRKWGDTSKGDRNSCTEKFFFRDNKPAGYESVSRVYLLSCVWPIETKPRLEEMLAHCFNLLYQEQKEQGRDIGWSLSECLTYLTKEK